MSITIVKKILKDKYWQIEIGNNGVIISGGYGIVNLPPGIYKIKLNKKG